MTSPAVSVTLTRAPATVVAAQDALIARRDLDLTVDSIQDPRATLEAYVQLYVREEIRGEALVRNLPGLLRFLPVAALFHGQVIPAEGNTASRSFCPVARQSARQPPPFTGVVAPTWRERRPNMLRTNTSMRVPLVAALLSITTCAAAQTTAPVVFEGLRHTPVGSATLLLDTSRHALDVLTADPDGNDGVAVDTGQATNWTASHRASIDPSRPLGMTWTAIADGQAVSTARLRQSGDRFALSAKRSPL